MVNRTKLNPNDFEGMIDYTNALIENALYDVEDGELHVKAFQNLGFEKSNTAERRDWIGSIGTDLRWEELTDKDVVEIPANQVRSMVFDDKSKRYIPYHYFLITTKDGKLAGMFLSGKASAGRMGVRSVNRTCFNYSDICKLIRTGKFTRKSYEMKVEDYKWYLIPDWIHFASDCFIHFLFQWSSPEDYPELHPENCPVLMKLLENK